MQSFKEYMAEVHEEERRTRRIGVWVEKGIVFRRDSVKDYNTTKYVPRRPDDLGEIRNLVQQLHDMATMDSWVAQTEAQYDQTLKELEKLIVARQKNGG